MADNAGTPEAVALELAKIIANHAFGTNADNFAEEKFLTTYAACLKATKTDPRP